MEPAPVRPKRIYFVRAHPQLAPGRFVARWREHGRLAMHFMALQGWRNVIRYVHCDALRPPDLPGLDPGWDGMGIVVFRDPPARREHLSFAAARQALEADEDAAFAARVNRSGLVAREQLLREGSPDGFKLVRVFRRPAGMDEAAFERQWRGQHVPRIQAAAAGALVRHVANWPLPPENGSAWGLDCAVIEELWFATTGDAARSLEAEQQALRRATGPGQPELQFAILTRETVLYEGPELAQAV